MDIRVKLVVVGIENELVLDIVLGVVVELINAFGVNEKNDVLIVDEIVGMLDTVIEELLLELSVLIMVAMVGKLFVVLFIDEVEFITKFDAVVVIKIKTVAEVDIVDKLVNVLNVDDKLNLVLDESVTKSKVDVVIFAIVVFGVIVELIIEFSILLVEVNIVLSVDEIVSELDIVLDELGVVNIVLVSEINLLDVMDIVEEPVVVVIIVELDELMA